MYKRLKHIHPSPFYPYRQNEQTDSAVQCRQAHCIWWSEATPVTFGFVVYDVNQSPDLRPTFFDTKKVS